MGQSTQDDRHTQLTKRREQLRISQKAYRNRKRGEYNRLQKRVDELENGVQEINDAFLDISKLLLDTNAIQTRPYLASALREVTRQCLSLAELVQTPTSASSQDSTENASNHSDCVHLNDSADHPDAG
ncbi:hypothetical protein PENANT_c039G00776 [Penicillium antarcticum]|uniref:BZIP domain-containing protein n=1 Tax=Penicillium antarcticum TaxID=416450 RepID=A0A1V6PT12_9EURO|nr:hypothetical protein PENANT_c039G00776 [Penicillium antarcticum]